MAKSLSELIDIPKLQNLLESLYKATGIPSGIIDKDSNILTAVGWQDICLKFHRIHPVTELRCRESNSFIRTHSKENECIGFKCRNGMLDYACPIIVQGEHLASLFLGQFFYEPPDEEYFRQQARTFAFDEEDYIEALRKVPIIAEERVSLILTFFSDFASMLADLGLRHIQQKEALEFVQNIMDAIPNPIFCKDCDGKYTDCNLAFSDLLGMSKQEILNKSVYEVGNNEFADSYREHDTVLLQQQKQTYEYKVRNSAGEVRDVIFNKALLSHWDGSPKGIVGVISDITDRKKMEDRLRESESKYRDMIHFMLNGMIYMKAIYDECGQVNDFRIVDVNKAFEDITGFKGEEYVDKLLSAVLPSREAIRDWVNTYGVVAMQGTSTSFEYYSKIFEKWFLVSAYSPKKDYCAIVFLDITERKSQEDMIEYYAYHDALTGLPNRRLLEESLLDAIQDSQKTGRMAAILFLDLDEFKPVNDSLGHDIGDRLLKLVAKRLVDAVRDTDVVSRIGGDEFVCVLKDITQRQQVDEIVARLLSVLKHPFKIDSSMIYISASIGIAMYPDHGCDSRNLLRNADIAMYSCKKKGRNQAQYYECQVVFDK